MSLSFAWVRSARTLYWQPVTINIPFISLIHAEKGVIMPPKWFSQRPSNREPAVYETSGNMPIYVSKHLACMWKFVRIQCSDKCEQNNGNNSFWEHLAAWNMKQLTVTSGNRISHVSPIVGAMYKNMIRLPIISGELEI